MLINASPLGKALLNGSSGGNVQSLAAALYVASTATAGLTNTEILGASSSVSSLTVGALAKTSPLGASASGEASSSGGLKNTIPLGSSVIVRTYGIGALYNIIPIASLAGTAAISNIIAANTSVAYSVSSSISVSVSASATANVRWVLEGSAQPAALASGYVLVDYVVSGLGSVDVSTSGDIPLTIPLIAGRPNNTVGGSTLGGFALNSGESFVKAGSTATGTPLIVFAASAQITCQSYAIGALYDTIPLADLESTGSISNVISADVALVKPIAGSCSSSSSSSADLLLIHEIDSSIATSSSALASVAVTKNFVASVSATSYAAPADTSVAYVIASDAQVSSSATAGVSLVKPIGGLSSSNVSTTANTSVHYVVSASVLTLVSVNAELAKTDNLQNLDGTGAISNILVAGLHLRKNLGFAALSLAASNGRVFVAHTVDAEIATGATATALADDIYLDVRSGEVFAEVTDVSYISSDYEYWQMAA